MGNDEEVKKIFENHKAVFDIKDEIIEAINGHDFNEINSAFLIAYSEFLMSCCNSQDQATDVCTDFAARCMTAIMTFSEEGLCNWNENSTLQ